MLVLVPSTLGSELRDHNETASNYALMVSAAAISY